THAFRAVRSTLATAFAHTVPYAVAIPSFFANWGYVLGARAPLPLVPPDLEGRWRAAGGPSWKYYDPAGHQALMYLPPGLRRRLSKPGFVASVAEPLAVYAEALPMDELDDAQ
ncbi:MAG: hypothetical protein ACK4N5_27050, partial [Myxococcales bacterium]